MFISFSWKNWQTYLVSEVRQLGLEVAALVLVLGEIWIHKRLSPTCQTAQAGLSNK